MPHTADGFRPTARETSIDHSRLRGQFEWASLKIAFRALRRDPSCNGNRQGTLAVEIMSSADTPNRGMPLEDVVRQIPFCRTAANISDCGATSLRRTTGGLRWPMWRTE
jgi:hypothetical protein